MSLLRLSLVAACVGALLGNSVGSTEATPKKPKKAAPAATGTVSGVVAFKGTAPKQPKITASQDPECAKLALVDQKVVVTGGHLRDVHVRIKSGTAGKHAVPTTTVSVDQHKCMYEPRVVGVMAGQKLAIRNSDPTFHNVRGTHGDHTVFNHGHPMKFPPIEHDSAGKPGEVLTLRCDIHPWMRGYAAVTDHPFFDVTGADGAFELKDVPVGSYTLEAWHPELGLESAKIVVKKNAPATITFTYP
jgi:plastocyanin